MSKGYQQNKARLAEVAGLGKDLVRRCNAKCELCGADHEKLLPRVVEPAPEPPDPEHAVMVCDNCGQGMAGGPLQPDEWHFLESVIWSEVPAVQVTAVRLCRRLHVQGVDWAAEVLDSLYLSPEVEAWLE